MAIQGLRSTNSPATDERPQSWRGGIAYLTPNGAGTAPFTALTDKMKSESVSDPQFNYWTKTMPSGRLRLGANIATNATALTVIAGATLLAAGEYADDATSIKVGDILMIEQTKEIIRVTSIASATSIDGIAYVKGSDYPTNTTLTAVTYNGVGVNPYVKIIGSAYREGADTPTAVSFNPVKMYNYTQIFRNALNLTNTAIQTELRTKEAVVEARREALEMHGQAMEMAFWFGQRTESIVSGTPLRTTQGFYNFVPASRKINAAAGDYASGMSYTMFEELMYNAFLWGAQEKIAWVGAGALLSIQRMVRTALGGQIMLGPQTKEYGFNVQRLMTPFGTLVLWNHPLFNTMTGSPTINSGFTGWTNTVAIMDMTGIRYRYVKNRDTKYLANRQGNGEDQLKSEYLTEAGIEWKHPETHLIIENFKTTIAEE